jgi:hypothetical protein
MTSEPARELRPDPPYRGLPSQDPDDESPAISRLKSGDMVVTVPGGTGKPASATRRRDRADAKDLGPPRLVAIATLTPLVVALVTVVWLVWIR